MSNCLFLEGATEYNIEKEVGMETKFSIDLNTILNLFDFLLKENSLEY